MNICSNKLCFLTTDVTLSLTSCALRHFRFMLIRHLIKTGAGIGLPLKSKAIQTPLASFFVSAYTHTSTMVGCMGLPSGRLVTLDASKANSVQSTASKIGLFCGGYIPTSKEAANMATIPTPTHPEFIWRFYSCQKRHYHFVIAPTEDEARSQLPDAPCIFSARF
ncbi:ash family protein, partial [Escherichia coli]|nr:ash family protein [Escherichia coli]EIA7217017.1 host cell division inhibitor Icd-like protein [Escherichia coli]